MDLTLGQRLEHAREAAGLKQEQVAMALGVKQQTVSRWETGETSPGTHRARALAELYGLDRSVVLEWVADHEERGRKHAQADRDVFRHRYEALLDRYETAIGRLDQVFSDHNAFWGQYEDLGHNYQQTLVLVRALEGRVDELERSVAVSLLEARQEVHGTTQAVAQLTALLKEFIGRAGD